MYIFKFVFESYDVFISRRTEKQYNQEEQTKARRKKRKIGRGNKNQKGMTWMGMATRQLHMFFQLELQIQLFCWK
jgi:hypothetical protein